VGGKKIGERPGKGLRHGWHRRGEVVGEGRKNPNNQGRVSIFPKGFLKEKSPM